MDVVYVCRAGGNEELRYSLRSLVNLPHDRVVVAGSWPRWITGVERVEVRSQRGKHASTTANLIAACGAGVSERFVYMNDDVFLMEPMAEVPTLHMGPIAKVVPRHPTLTYAARMKEMETWLAERGYPTLCYELHVPMIFERDRLLEALALPVPPAVRDRHKRSLYGNVYGVGGEQVDDCKVIRAAEPLGDRSVVSTTDNVFRHGVIGKAIRERFCDPSPYEAVI